MALTAQMTHSPADVVAQALVDLGLGTDPEASPLGTWPVYAHGEPDLPDEVVTVTDTQGVDGPRDSNSGIVARHWGVQVKVRSGKAQPSKRGATKAHALREAMETTAYGLTVTLDSSTYKLHAFVKIGGVLYAGREPQTGRFIHTINPLVVLRQLS